MLHARLTLAQRVAAIDGSSVFANLPSTHSASVLSMAYEKTFARRQKVFVEHDPVTHVVLLVSGCVKEMQVSRNGGEVILRLDGPGDLIGPAWRSTKNHESAAQAMRISNALIWEIDCFERLAVRFPVLQRNMANILEERLAVMQQRFREVSTDTAASRLSNELLRLLNQMGQRVNGHIQVTLSREELAQLTATSLFTVSRLLSKWEELGIVTAQREAVLVRDLSALAGVAQTESRYTVRPSE